MKSHEMGVEGRELCLYVVGFGWSFEREKLEGVCVCVCVIMCEASRVQMKEDGKEKEMVARV